MSDENGNNSNIDAVDEELVAYLDGELQPQEAQRIQNLLASDAQARDRLSQLASSWDLLDQLPRASVDDLFTRTTVEMVALAAENEIKETVAAEPAKRRMRMFGGAIAAAVAVLVGFVAMALALPDRNDELLRDLPVVRDLDQYRAVGDIKLLHKLRDSRLFADDAPASVNAGGEKGATHSSNLSLPIPVSLVGRRGWVEGLSAAEKAELRRQFESYTALPESEQQSLRRLVDDIQNDPQSFELQHIMARYNEWLKTLSPADRAELSEKSPEAQVAEIQRRGLQRLAGPRPQGMGKGQEGVRPVVGWMVKFAHDHELQILSQLPSDLKEQAAKESKQEDRFGPSPYDLWLARQLWRPDSPVKEFPPIDPTELKDLRAAIEQLPTERKDRLPQIQANGAQLAELRDWLQPLLRGRFGGGFPFRGGMGRRPPVEWTADEKQQLDGLTGVELQRKQEELYRKKFGLPELRGKGPPGEGPRDWPGKDGPDHPEKDVPAPPAKNGADKSQD